MSPCLSLACTSAANLKFLSYRDILISSQLPRNCKISAKLPRSANAAGSARHERADAELTGAGGPSPAGATGALHAWLADVEPAGAFVRHRRFVPRPARDDPDRLDGARPDARGRRAANDRGSS